MNQSLKALEQWLAQWMGNAFWVDMASRAGALLLVSLLVWILWRLLERWRKSIHRWIDADGSGARALTVQDQQIFTERELARALHIGVNGAWRLLRAILLISWLNLVFTQFAWSRDLAVAIIAFVLAQFGLIAAAVVNYLPNLFIIAIIVVISRLVIRAVRGIFDGIRLERITLPGFYPDWAETSFGLSRLLIIAITLVIVFPYLPGSSSPAFQGLSIFFGVLVSLGSTSAVANVMSGIVITYTRGFKIGDRVRIADTEGDVIERSAFVTRIRTPKNEEVSVPNAMVMNNHIVNFSAQAKEAGVLLHTTVTIGYDVPWPQVHQLLCDAAIATTQVLEDPAPFVLQTSLDDNYVAYELNAYIRNPSAKQQIASEMHAHIQDNFRDANIEILSPHYRANRDASAAAIPLRVATNDDPPTPTVT
ncbi:mechanosensitive ion channel family protein [Congregibacter litoralis]|uniref:Small-conductance mechanosensitive channel n=1 Tax=Congregibacter litoralis KT71 TaxID=314285 RepID=A4AAM7_9GAMM|nr:mechanosensitive ion channel family protein [Congregibacter litoralis]EAQ97104.1 Small-conductance mechanosensitive channel [Congregibacter litoralis KT71]